jgi:hypothetical protein
MTPAHNNGRRYRKLLTVLGAVAGALLVTGFYLPGGVALAVTPIKGGPALAVLYLEPNERFTIRYYHSVENAPIWETHSVDSRGRIYIEEERYLKFGAGMGKMPGVGKMAHRGPYEIIQEMHMPTGNFVLRIGSPGVDHTLIWKKGQINLSKLAPHEAVRFRAEPISWLRRFCYRLFSARDGS